jgi:PAS domain S-box-containing protein
MRVSRQVTRQLFEAAESAGFDRLDIERRIGPSLVERLVSHDGSGRQDVDWNDFAEVLAALEEASGASHERMRAVGRALVHVPTWWFIRKLAQSTMPLRGLYEAGAAWVAPAAFPHLVLDQRFVGEREIRELAKIPEPYAPAPSLFWLFEGVLQEIPVLLGLPRAELLDSIVTPRTLESRLMLPRSGSLMERAMRRARAFVKPVDLLEAYEVQRRELTEGLTAMRKASLEIRTLFENIPDLVIVHRKGTILWKNKAAVKALGYDGQDDLVGRPLLDIIAPASREVVAHRIANPDDPDVPDLIETLVLTRDRQLLHVEVAPSCEVIFGGSPARLVVARDVTERVRMQQRLAMADRMASIGMLAAGVAHEVNNPLAYVLNNIEIARRDLKNLGESGKRSREALGVALEGVERIRTIVHDLLMLSRVDDTVVGPVDLREVVESTVALASKDIASRAQLVCELENVPLVKGSAARLGQVLLNLIVNADESMQGSPREENELRVALRPSAAGGALVEISDTGVGVPPELATRIFDPFFTTKPHGQGTGLGLSISQMLVAEIGGQLTFRPHSPKGSTFSLTLAPAISSTVPPA